MSACGSRRAPSPPKGLRTPLPPFFYPLTSARHAHLSRHEGDAEDSDEDDGSGSSAAAVEEAHHYSLYAFNGRTSLLMWKHEESDSLDVEVGPQEEVRSPF